MKRIFGVMAPAMLLALLFASCEQMFTTNLFSGLTHPKPTASQITEKTAAELAKYVDSEANLKILAENPELKAAALAKLETVYEDPATPPAEKQTAAATAATISIETVESASNFSSNLLGALTASAASTSSGSSGSGMDSPTGVIDLLKDSLGEDISSQLASSDEPPASFKALIAAFVESYDAYAALGQSVAESGGYAAGADISESEKNGIAINAIIASLVVSVEPVDGTKTQAQALWAALRNPEGASGALKISDMDNLKALPIYSLVTASSLGSLVEE